MAICYTCLSKDRALTPLSKLGKLILETKVIKMNYSGFVCWECRGIMEKFTKFKKQASKAQELLKIQKLEDLPKLTSLIIETKFFFDSEYHYTDPLTNNAKTEESELQIKKEDDSDGSDVDDKFDFDDDFDVKPEEIKKLDSKLKVNADVYVEKLEKREMKKVKKRKVEGVSEIKDVEKLMEKFLKVVYSEEEMRKKREEKRNQPNFKKIPYKCDSCVLGFTKKETYEEHLTKKHDESIGPLQCDVCHIRFSKQNSVTKHRQQHYVSYRCRFCPYITSQLWSAFNHSRVKHGADTSGNVHCTQCDTVTSTPEELSEHLKTNHILHCNECGEKFKGKNTLRTHKIRIHGAKRQFICDVCSKSFNTRSRLESHMTRHSKALASRLSYCSTCRVQYKNIYVYRNHLRNSSNHADTQYPCPQCDKKFSSKVYWKKHYNFYHLQKSQYSCEVCNKLFISDWRLKNHKQKHHGLSRSRDHACNVCGKKFYTLSTLRGHQLTHSDLRSYMCEDCGDTFKQRPALYTHHRLVHTPKKTT